MFGFPLDTMLFLWVVPLGLAVFQIVYAYRSSSHEN